jgi:hypothetical protein
LHFNGGGTSSFAQNCTSRNFNPPAKVPNSNYWYANFFRRSDDCGASWGTPASDGSMPYSTFYWVDPTYNINWNIDQAKIYVDPFNVSASGNYYVQVHGGVALAAHGVIESGDRGTSFPEQHYVGDTTLAKKDGYGYGNLTSTSDGTDFFAACVGADVRLYYSYNRWQTYQYQTLTWNGGSTNCGVLTNPGPPATSGWPANGLQSNIGAWGVAVSRIAFSSLKPNYARVRVAYPTVINVPTFGNREQFRVLEVGVARKGKSATPYQNQIAWFGGVQDYSVIEAGFAEPDPFDTPRGGSSSTTTDLPDTAVFWSVEADHSVPSLMARYRVWQGASSYSTARDLSPVSWSYATPRGVGDYNRSTYYYDTTAKRGNYVLVWPQGEQTTSPPGVYSAATQPHYNVVAVRPALDATTVVPEELDFGSVMRSGPAVSSQGPNTLDIFWVDTNGNLQEKSYNNGWLAGLTQLPAPPASAGGIQGDPAAVSWGPGRNDLFIRGNDNRIYQAWRQGGAWTWTPWPMMPDTVSSSPAAASRGSGNLHVFARFPDGSVRFFRYVGGVGWDTSWTNLSGVTDMDPVATSDTTSLHLFARGGGNCIYHKYSTDGLNWLPSQTTWENLPCSLAATTGPAAASWGPGRFDVFAGNNGVSGGTTMMHLDYENGWQSEWGDLQTNRNGLTLTSAVDAVSWAPQRVDAFGKDGNNKLWHTWYSMP